MRVLVIVKSTPESESGATPSTEMMAEMGLYNEELVKHGIMQMGEGLLESRHGKRVRFEGKNRTVIDGPFTQSKDLVAGFWIWKVKSMDEAVEWLKKAPFDDGMEIEIRRIAEMEDFGENFTQELREQEEKLRSQIEAQRN